MPVRQVAASRERLSTAAPWLTALSLFLLYAAWSVSSHLRHETTGFDLGIFEQGVRGYAGLGFPVADLKAPGFNLLGDHFHPILVVLAPFYRLFPGPITLLVAQAALIAVSAVPVTRLAVRRAGLAGGTAIGVAYGLSWGLQAAADFDFHEVAFAVPLLAFSLVAVTEQRWRAAVGWALPLLLVKEDLPATVAAIGLVLAIRGRRRTGAVLAVSAIAAGVLIVAVVIPAFNPADAYPYTTGAAAGDQNPFRRLLTPAIKWQTVLFLLAPTCFLAVRSPLLLVAVPTLLWRFWSTNGFYWGAAFQYSAVLMPIVFVAALDALPRLTGAFPRLERALPRLTGAFPRLEKALPRLPAALPGAREARAVRFVAGVMAGAAVAATIIAPLPLRGLAHPATWRIEPAVASTNRILAMIPDGATVAADNRLAPQLTARCTVYLFPGYPGGGIVPEWVVYTEPYNLSMANEETIDAALARLRAGYETAAQKSGTTLLRRR